MALPAALDWSPVNPDTYKAEIVFDQRWQGRFRVTIPALSVFVDRQGGTDPVMTLDEDTCDPLAASPPPLQFEFLLVAPCVLPTRVAPFTGPDDFFLRRLPHIWNAADGWWDSSVTPLFLGEISGACCPPVVSFDATVRHASAVSCCLQ